MLTRSTSMVSVTMGIIAERWRGNDTWSTVYWKSSPILPAAAAAMTLAVGSRGVSALSCSGVDSGAACWADLPGAIAATPLPLGIGGGAGAGLSAALLGASSMPASYVCGRKLVYNSGLTTGLGIYNGAYSS